MALSMVILCLPPSAIALPCPNVLHLSVSNHLHPLCPSKEQDSPYNCHNPRKL